MCHWKNIFRCFSLLIIILFGVFTIIASGGGGGDGGVDEDDNNDNGAVECEPTIDVTGTWIIAYTIGENDCNAFEGQVGTGFMLLAQNGNSISNLINGSSGEICGNSFTISSPENAPPGYSFIMTGAGTSTSLSGETEYTYPFDGGCSGNDTYTAVKTDDWFDTATTLELPYTSNNESLNSPSGIKFYKFTTADAGAISVSVSNLDMGFFFLFDESLNKLDMLPVFYNNTITYSSESAGTFYVAVACQSDTIFTLEVSLNDPDGDGNDTFGTATQIILPYTSAGASIDPSGDLDYYVFTTAEAGIISVNLTGLSSNLDLVLFDADHNILDDSMNSGTANEAIEYSSSAPGTFYVIVDSYEAVSGDYTLTVTIEPGGGDDGDDSPFETATPITLPYTSTGASIDTSAEVDYYVFTTTEAGTYHVTLNGLSANLNLYFYESFFGLQTPSASSTNEGTQSESIDWTNPMAGSTYYVMVSGAGVTSNYTLSVTSE